MRFPKIAGLVALLFVYVDGYLECIECNADKNLADCLSNKVACGAEEACFMEKIFTSNLEVIYVAGCRSRKMCGMQTHGSVVGKKRDLHNCVQCCDTPPNGAVPCNARLCNLAPDSNVTNANKCMSCPFGVTSVNACTTKAVCQDTEICSTEIKWEGSPRYYFGCEYRETCRRFLEIGVSPGVGHGGRRDSSLTLCSACCTGNECNKADCFNLRKNMTLAALGTNPPLTVPVG